MFNSIKKFFHNFTTNNALKSAISTITKARSSFMMNSIGGKNAYCYSISKNPQFSITGYVCTVPGKTIEVHILHTNAIDGENMATIVFHRTGAGVYSHVVINEFEEENFPLIHKVKDFEEHIESSVRNDEMFVPVFRDVPGEGLKMKVASSGEDGYLRAELYVLVLFNTVTKQLNK